LEQAGIPRTRLILDPGMGFFLGTDADASFTVLRRLPDYEVDHSRLVRAETIGVTYGMFAMPITFTAGHPVLA
jgi:dihydropteroate synthase